MATMVTTKKHSVMKNMAEFH